MKLSHTDKETIEQCTAPISIMFDHNYFQVKNVHKPHIDIAIVTPISKKAVEISPQYYENITSKYWIETKEGNC
jgi:hypothetical protein